MSPKQRAADAAIDLVRDNMTLGLGTGSTADCFLQALGESIRQGKLHGIRGIPTSQQSQRRAQQLGIPLATFAQCPRPDLTIDGADEISPSLDLIKGRGGALLREKIVAQCSRELVIIADESKLVPRLGTRVPLPIEVATFGHETHFPFFQDLGATPVLRTDASGKVFVTDNGNYIYDCRFPEIDDPAALQRALNGRAGIIGTGLFLGIASRAIIGGEDRVRTLKRQ